MNNNCYAIISGSTRPQSESRKVEPLILEVLVRNPKEELADSVDFANDQSPLLEEAIWSKGIDWHSWAQCYKKSDLPPSLKILEVSVDISKIVC